QRRGRLAELKVKHLIGRLGIKWTTPREHLVENDSKRIEVGSAVHICARDLLWCHVVRCSKHRSDVCGRTLDRLGTQLCEAEVQHSDDLMWCCVLGTLHVVWLVVTMTGALAVGRAQCLRHLPRNVKRAARVETTFELEHLCKVATLNQFEGEVVGPVLE